MVKVTRHKNSAGGVGLTLLRLLVSFLVSDAADYASMD